MFQALPVVAYAALALSFVVGYALQGDAGLALVSFFSMGSLSLVALAQPVRSPPGG